MDMIADPKLHKIGSEFAAEWVRRLHNGEEEWCFANLTNASGGGPFEFTSPVIRGGYSDPRKYVPILKSITKVLRDLTYHQVMVGTDVPTNTARVALHFKATVHHEGKKYVVDGIDLFVVDGETKRATSLMVLARPHTAVTALSKVMHEHIVAYTKSHMSQSKL